jgi:hypothetical protein
MVFPKALSPCVADIIQAWNEFPVQGIAQYLRATTMRRREHISLGEEASEPLSWMELSQRSPQTVRNKTPNDHQSHNRRHRNRELSWQVKFYFCSRECRHMVTANTKSRL